MTERWPPETPQARVQRAGSDLALAQAALENPDVFLEDACFHAQQCVEKALKGLLIQHRVTFPRTHVLETLLDLLRADAVWIPPDVDESLS